MDFAFTEEFIDSSDSGEENSMWITLKMFSDTCVFSWISPKILRDNFGSFQNLRDVFGNA